MAFKMPYSCSFCNKQVEHSLVTVTNADVIKKVIMLCKQCKTVVSQFDVPLEGIDSMTELTYYDKEEVRGALKSVTDSKSRRIRGKK